MSRTIEISRELSEFAQEKDKCIIFFVTDERNLLETLFTEQKDELKKICGHTPDMDRVFFIANWGKEMAHDTRINPFCNMEGSTGDNPYTFAYINDFHIYTANNGNQGMLLVKHFVDEANKARMPEQRLTLIITGPYETEFPGFEQYIKVIYVLPPDRKDITDMITKAAADYLKEDEEKIRKQAERTAAYFVGLSKSQINAVIAKLTDDLGDAFFLTVSDNDKKDAESAIKKQVEQTRKESAALDKTMTFKDTENPQVIGMDGYTKWFDENSKSIENPEESKIHGISPPRGVLFCGLPGTGKTEAARYTAKKIGAPLIELRMDNILNKYLGESEGMFKRFRKKAESITPCVILVDEIEKTLGDDGGSGGGTDSIKKHLLQALLDWLQDGKEGLFFYATCNSLRGLEGKPELFRSGRFSVKYSVFLPSYDDLVKILALHIKARQEIIEKNNGEMQLGRNSDKVEKNAEEAAVRFLDLISKEISEGKEYFYTGADARELVINTQILISQNNKTHYTSEEYAKKMLETALSDRCKPYAYTNFRDVGEFWLLARKNRYADATNNTLFPFDNFIPGKPGNENDNKKAVDSKFEPCENLKTKIEKHKYNKKMFEIISNEIIRQYDLNIRNNQNRRYIDVE